MPGGILWGNGEDWNRLRDSVRRVVDRFSEWPTTEIRLAEIGIMEAKTSRDLIEVIQARIDTRYTYKLSFLYYGIDAFANDPGYIPGFIFVKGMSHEVLDRLPNSFHWVFIDGCHCVQCASRDIACYAPLLVSGGELCFHDASPLEQFKGDGNPASAWAGDHHDPAEAAKGTAVRSVLDSVMANRPDFRLVLRAQQEQISGGVETYEKV